MEDISACEEVIQILTGQKLKICSVKSQYSIRHLKTHSVILDIIAESCSGKLVNIEMQSAENENHLKRSRYHRACIDASILEKGKAFHELPELYSIFITKADFFKCGRGIYHIDRVLREGNILIDNGIHEIYANLKGAEKNPVIRSLLNYINNTDINYNNEHFPNLINRVRFYKEKKEGIDIMCEILDEERAIGIEEGIKLGSEKCLEKVNHLNQLLASQNRISDIIKSACDPAYQTKLFMEFHL